MKNLIQLLVFSLILGLQVSSTAQFSVAVLMAPVSAVTTTKILAPLGIELKFSPTKSMVLAYGIPIFDIKSDEYNEKVASFSIEFRSYAPATIQKKYRKYYAVKLRHRPESYILENNSYFKNGVKEILFDYAEVNSTINSVSIRFGLQRIFNNNIILDFNFGFGINNKTVTYKNVIIAPPPFIDPNYGWGDIFDLELTPYDYFSAFTSQPDNIAKSHTFINIPMSIRVGYLFSRK